MLANNASHTSGSATFVTLLQGLLADLRHFITKKVAIFFVLSYTITGDSQRDEHPVHSIV